jgi:hypothetical protein
MSRAYAELSGAEGRNALYRSERHRARDLFGPMPPRVSMAGGSCVLDDISMTGLAVLAPANDALPALGDAVEVGLGEAGAELYRGAGAVARIDAGRRGARISLRLLDGHLDLGELVARHRHQRTLRDLDEHGYLHARFVPAEYRRLCADVAFMLTRYRRVLDDAEGAAARGGPADRRRLEELTARCAESFTAEFRELWREGYASVLPLLGDRRAVGAAKRLTEQLVTPHLLDGPIWRRSYEKPLGYPGDFQVMQYVYDGTDQGDSAYARLCHRVGIEVGMCVRTRMQMIAERLTGLLAGDGEALRVASLGCGPAVEVAAALGGLPQHRAAVFTLIDQDRVALDRAYANVLPLVNARAPRLQADLLQLSFGQLLAGTAALRHLPPQDMIYCAGLIDYLPEQQAQGLVAALFGRLAPGGTLVVGNMKAGTDNVWPLGFVLDWELIYRDEAQMHGLAALTKPAAVELALDPTGYNYLLHLTAQGR